ncbi:hypothetical protein CLV63_11549 [Murinocardiopsis flavida]|uniref:Uncharacterized protein n=2 Tax=Murinocardiopsis flavida TaxID=645275 RepID=A0A2P8DDX7_9ACTN|nr:hypothetical protein CLV63_11549 [Murinocardiopsis flavida]
MVFQGFVSAENVVGLILLGVAEVVFALWLARCGAGSHSAAPDAARPYAASPAWRVTRGGRQWGTS